MKALQFFLLVFITLGSLGLLALNLHFAHAAPDSTARLLNSLTTEPSLPAATITVTNTNDSGAGSLRQAIAAAVSSDTINFAITGTIVLTSGELSIAKSLTISGPGANSLTVSGNNNSRVFEINTGNVVTISGLTVANGNTNTIGGGGIYNRGRLVLNSDTLTHNLVTGSQKGGGAIFNSLAATLVVTNSTIVSNTSQNYYAGGIYNYGGLMTLTNSFVLTNTGVSGAGLAIQNSGTGYVVSSTVSGNIASAVGSNGGGGIYEDGGSLVTLVNSMVISNSSLSIGSGIANEGPNSALILTNSSILRNTSSAGFSGGGIHNAGYITANASSVLSNTAFDGGGIYNDGGEILFSDGRINGNQSADDGGGIYGNNGKLTIDRSTIFSNTTHFAGGGILNRNDMTVTNSTVTSNTANFGGGISTSYFDPVHPTVLISNTNVVSNTALNSVGGGISNFQGHLILINSTVLSNTAPNYGGGIDSEGISGTLQLTNVLVAQNSVGSNSGGGIYTSHPTTITNSTISSNQAGSGGGIFSFYPAGLINSTVTNNSASAQGGGIYQSGAYSVSLKNTIVAGNPSPSASPDCSGTLVSLGYNLLGDNTGCAGLTNGVNGDKVGTGATPINPLLGPLQNNAGPTWTQALLLGSPAINAGNPLGCNDALGILLRTDQRGMPRPYGGPCDIGAFEFVAPYFLPVILHP